MVHAPDISKGASGAVYVDRLLLNGREEVPPNVEFYDALCHEYFQTLPFDMRRKIEAHESIAQAKLRRTLNWYQTVRIAYRVNPDGPFPLPDCKTLLTRKEILQLRVSGKTRAALSVLDAGIRGVTTFEASVIWNIRNGGISGPMTDLNQCGAVAKLLERRPTGGDDSF